MGTSENPLQQIPTRETTKYVTSRAENHQSHGETVPFHLPSESSLVILPLLHASKCSDFNGPVIKSRPGFKVNI